MLPCLWGHNYTLITARKKKSLLFSILNSNYCFTVFHSHPFLLLFLNVIRSILGFNIAFGKHKLQNIVYIVYNDGHLVNYMSAIIYYKLINLV